MSLLAPNRSSAWLFHSPRAIWRDFRCLVTNRITWPESEFLVNHDRKLLYCPIAKVACSSIKRWFLAELGEHLPELSSIHKGARNHRLRGESGRCALRILRDPNYFKFAFIRNPWARLVSGYLNKFLRVNFCSTRFARDMGAKTSHDPGSGGLVDVTFEQFVHHLAVSNPTRFDVHWRPQHLYLTGHRFELLGRFEHLSDDFAALQSRIGTRTPLPHCKPTRYDPENKPTETVADQSPADLLARGPLPDYRAFYTPELRQIVQRLYAADIRLGNYEFAPE